MNLSVSDKFDAYIIVSFVNATLVLSIGETVEEVTDSGFLGTTPTLSCSSLADHALVQVLFYNIFFLVCFLYKLLRKEFQLQLGDYETYSGAKNVLFGVFTKKLLGRVSVFVLNSKFRKFCPVTVPSLSP